MTHKERLQNQKLELLRELHSVEEKLESYDKILFISPDKPFINWDLSELQSLAEINLDAYEWFNDPDSPSHRNMTIRDYNSTHTDKVRFQETE